MSHPCEKRTGLTQQELAEKLFVTNKTISKWERSIGYPEICQLASVAKFCGVTANRLLCGDRDWIAIAGNLLTDNVKIIETYPEKGMLSSITKISRDVGGCVPNVGINLAKIDGNIQIEGIGRVGNDEHGRYVLMELPKHGIDISGIITPQSAPTSFSDVMSIRSTGERTFFHHRGANAEFSPNDIILSSLSSRMLHIAYILLLDSFDQPDPKCRTVMAAFSGMFRS